VLRLIKEESQTGDDRPHSDVNPWPPGSIRSALQQQVWQLNASRTIRRSKYRTAQGDYSLPPSPVRLIRRSSLGKHLQSRFFFAEFVEFFAELLDQLLKSHRICLLRDELAELLPAFLKWPFHAKKGAGANKKYQSENPA
jgi:hypothetical protein